MADVRTPELVINKLTKQQYENIQNPSDTEIYLVREDEEHKPICYPTTASEVKTTSMLVKSCVSDNGKIITERGFVYDTSPSPVITGNKLICDVGIGMMDGVLDNLTQNTEYHIRSYGINGSGISYGSELVQRTPNNPIPVEYQLVEYLQSSGTQYIGLSYIHQSNVGLYAVCGKTSNSPNDTVIIGTCNPNAPMILYYNSKLYAIYKTGIGIAGSGIFADNELHSFSINYNNDGNCYIDNNLDYTTPYRNNTKYIGLFCRYSTGVFDYQKASRIHSVFLSSNGVPEQKLYSVYRIADNKPGMYDIVNNVFYTNQGAGEFIVGPDKEFGE